MAAWTAGTKICILLDHIEMTLSEKNKERREERGKEKRK
jgi:hypothetical protein